MNKNRAAKEGKGSVDYSVFQLLNDDQPGPKWVSG